MIPKADCKLGWYELEQSEEIRAGKRTQHQTHAHNKRKAGLKFCRRTFQSGVRNLVCTLISHTVLLYIFSFC